MKVYNRHRDKDIPQDAIYIGRPSKWGNPFIIGKHGTRNQVIHKYRKMILSRPEFVTLIRTELRGKDLVCSCSPSPCHGDVLMEIANS